VNVVPLPSQTRVCRGKCQRELPLTEEYFRPVPGLSGSYRKKCRKCEQRDNWAARSQQLEAGRAAKKAAAGKWKPRVVGESGPEGGYTEHPDDGYRWVQLPDSHGDLIDWSAAEATLAFVRFYRPTRIFMTGDHVDFAAFSRFDKPPTDIGRILDDLAALRKYLALIRQSAPNAHIEYLKGNHEARFARFLWKNEVAAAMLKAKGMDLPTFLELGDFNIQWVESGAVMVNERFMAKHGHMVRARSGYTATGELERNGISGISGHTHRLSQVYKRSRAGMMTWAEGGCTCLYDPDYMEGQTSDWQQGLSFGTIAHTGNGFSVHTAPIIDGRVRALGTTISA